MSNIDHAISILQAVKAAIPLSNLPDQSYPQQGLNLLAQAKRFLLEEKLIRKDFSVEQWRIAGLV